MKKLVKVLAAVAAFAVVIVAAVWFLTGNATKVIDAQLAAQKSGDFQSAYDLNSTAFKQVTSYDEFVSFVKSYPALADNQKATFNDREIVNDTATLTGTLTAADGSQVLATYQLVKEDGSWKVQSIDVSAAGVATAAGDPTASDDDSADATALTRVFAEEGYGYTIGYPSAWSLSTSDQLSILFYGPEDTDAYDTTVNIQNVATTGLSELVDDLRLQFTTADPAAVLSANTDYAVSVSDGTTITGTQFNVTYVYQGTTYQQRQIVVPGTESGIFHAWAYTAPTKVYAGSKAIADAMLQSWTLVKTTTSAIVVEAITGTLTNGQSYSYIAESARGPEAYLGDGGARATYTVPADTAGDYTLWIHTSDDGLHSDGARSVTVTVNDQTLPYVHVSEDTAGFKWYSLGAVFLLEGTNTVTFTKDETTSAAFVMDQFKLEPVSL